MSSAVRYPAKCTLPLCVASHAAYRLVTSVLTTSASQDLVTQVEPQLSSLLALIGKSGSSGHKSDKFSRNVFDMSLGRYFDGEAEELMYAASHHGRVEIAPA